MVSPTQAVSTLGFGNASEVLLGGMSAGAMGADLNFAKVRCMEWGPSGMSVPKGQGNPGQA